MLAAADDVFKASDYRISPFELESALIEHPAVAEAAVVPAPDAIRLAVPKAYITLTANSTPDRATALSIFQHLRETLAPFKRVRRLEFADLPKTISGKIRRVELRREEEVRATEDRRGAGEFREEDFPELTVADRHGPLREGVGGGAVPTHATPPPPNPLPQGEGEARNGVGSTKRRSTFQVSRAIGLSKFR